MRFAVDGRQPASQHLAVLEAVDLVSTTWHGRGEMRTGLREEQPARS